MNLSPNTISAVIDALTALHAEMTTPDAVDFTAYTTEDAEALLGRLPVGATVEDGDRDQWQRKDTGWHLGSALSPTPVKTIAEYHPLRVTHLPEPVADTPTASGTRTPAVGDRVRVLEGFHAFGADISGLEGTLVEIRPNYDGTGRTCYIVDWRTAGAVEVISEAEPEPEPASEYPAVVAFDSVNDDRRFQLKPSFDATYVWITVSEPDNGKSVFAIVDPPIARRIAAYLTAYADAQESPS